VVENDLEGTLLKVREGWTEAIRRFEPPWALVLLDLRFYTGPVTEQSHHMKAGVPKGRRTDDDPTFFFGWTLLDAIHSAFPELPVYVLSEMPREEVSLEFSRRGALGFIDRDDLHGAEFLKRALSQHGLIPDYDGEILGYSLPVLLALRDARRAASFRENLLIHGERGTGKGLFARYIHKMSVSSKDEKERPFVAVNSAQFSTGLFASELFGIEPQTATGVKGKPGIIEVASHGDLFLDEIADMQVDVQAAMLNVLQERRIARVGSREMMEVDVRFLSATNSDLENDPRGFRPDLLDRLRMGGTISLPPLRDRPIDIPLLTQKLVREAESRRGGTIKRSITPEFLESLQSHTWPGNIRELESVIRKFVMICDVEHLLPSHLPFGMEGKRRSSGVEPISQRTAGARTIASTAVSTGSPKETLVQLIKKIADFEFEESDREGWAGKFPRLHSSIARLAAKYIRAALVANRKPTPENPKGEILIHPAMKLLTGNRQLTATNAADLIKRLLSISPEDRDEILKDEILFEAFEIAMRLRPTRRKNKTGTGKESIS
jgi:DNA-binding NtrC family response regulator